MFQADTNSSFRITLISGAWNIDTLFAKEHKYADTNAQKLEMHSHKKIENITYEIGVKWKKQRVLYMSGLL